MKTKQQQNNSLGQRPVIQHNGIVTDRRALTALVARLEAYFLGHPEKTYDAIAREIGPISPASILRARRGKRPTVRSYFKIVSWLEKVDCNI